MAGEPIEERVVLITGGASGIGAALARRLAAGGAATVLWDRNGEGAETLAGELERSGARAWARQVELTDAVQIEEAAQWTFETAGRVTGLVNCAGIYPVTPLLEITPEEWDRVLDTNLRAPFLVTGAVARRMIAARTGGAIVNVSSTASRLARPGIGHYGASKAGLNQLTAVMAVELAPHGIRVNAILPGLIATEAVLESAAGAQLPPGEHQAKLERIPLGRMGEPEEVVGLAEFLLSPNASYCTGGLYTVDGGFTLGIATYGADREGS